ncbi:GATA-type zinc finger protein 1 isoform X1 [Arapaima gigas]
MSTDSENAGSLRPSTTKDTELQDDPVPQSTILYLLQEATKLATPAKEEWRLASGPCAAEQNVPCSCGPVVSPSLPPVKGRGLDLRPNYSGSFSLLPSQRGNSPWEVMSLINLQCERLLHHTSEEGEEDGGRLMTNSASEGVLFHSAPEASGCNGGLAVFKEIDTSEHPQTIKDTLGDVEGWGSALRERKPGDGLLPLHSCHKVISTEPVLLEVPPRQVEVHWPLDKEKKQDVGTQLANDEVVEMHCLRGTLNSESLKGKMVAPCLMGAELWGKLNKCGAATKYLRKPACGLQQEGGKQEINLNKPEELICSSVPLASLADDVKMDCNSNLILTSGSHQNVEGSQISLRTLTREFEPGNQEQVLAEETHSPFHDSCKNSGKNIGAQPPDAVTAKLVLDSKWRGRTPRKQRHPTRSADICDPDFRGVSFRMQTELDDNRDQCRLLITSKYSAEFWKTGRRVRGSRTRSIINSLKSSSSEEETDAANLSKNKMCASCCTKTTPLWRDAEDGTPLCNACGIRYKKYRVHCHQCWFIPRKEGNSNSRCFRASQVLANLKLHLNKLH